MNKSELLAALAALNIEAPQSATLVQLRKLFDQQSKVKVNAIIHANPPDMSDEIDFAPIDDAAIEREAPPQDSDTAGIDNVTEPNRNALDVAVDVDEQNRTSSSWWIGHFVAADGWCEHAAHSPKDIKEEREQAQMYPQNYYLLNKHVFTESSQPE